MSRRVVVVSHTHWDREWYDPFEAYRERLVGTLDAALDLLEEDPAFAALHLDGQMAMLDDYLAARPEAGPRVRRLIAAGRLSAGPWYVLPDEFAVSAETLVRNLQSGLSGAAAMGGRPTVGYLPDMFGHVAAMPQILGQAGMSDAVVWRGVPSAVDAQAFWWESPDGTVVRAEYLPVGYANGAFLPEDPVALVRRVAAHEKEIGAFLRPGWPMLVMNGGDHQAPQPWVPGLLRAANEAQDGFRFEQGTLEHYIGTAPREGLARWAGELRSGWRAPLLMGVHSNRVDVKAAAAAAEEALERGAEPLAALWLPPWLWPARALGEAWRLMVLNSAHDSICACSADEVVRAVMARYDSAVAIAGRVVSEALSIAGVATASAGHVVVNPSSRSRGGLVELTVPGSTCAAGCQQLAATGSGAETRMATGARLATVLAELAQDGWLGGAGKPARAELSGEGPGTVLRLQSGGAATPDPANAAVMAEAWARAGSAPDDPLAVVVERHAEQRVLAKVTVPGWGWSMLSPVEPGWPVSVDGLRIDNGLVSVEVDASTGTVSVDGRTGFNRLVDEADGGDTYNFSAVPGAPVVDLPVSVEVVVKEAGPLRAVVQVARTYSWPTRLQGSGRVGETLSLVETEVEVRCDERAVRFATTVQSNTRDRRLRAVFPVEGAAGRSEAGCAFGTVVRRGAEGGPWEPALATYPARRFVTAGNLTVFTPGLMEYEVLDDALFLTLLRSVGVLARPAPPARPNAAGPATPLEGSLMQGTVRSRYAIAPSCEDPWAMAEDLWTPLEVVRSEGVGHLPDAGARLQVEGGVVSALYRRDGALEIRVHNPRPAPATVTVTGHSGSLIDLTGREVDRWSESFELGAWRFATARLDARSLDGRSPRRPLRSTAAPLDGRSARRPFPRQPGHRPVST